MDRKKARDVRPGARVETVDEFLLRGGHIKRIEHYPDPEGRVLRRGQRPPQPKVLPRVLTNPLAKDAY